MDRRFLTVIGVSLVFALVVSSVFYQMTSRANTGVKENYALVKNTKFDNAEQFKKLRNKTSYFCFRSKSYFFTCGPEKH